METLQAVYIGNLRSEAVHNQSGTQIETDAPTDNKGKGERFSPTDLVATALGTCMLTTMAIAAQNSGFEITGTRVTVNKIMKPNPRRIGQLVAVVTFPDLPLTEAQYNLVEQAAIHCPVAKSLHPDLEQDISFKYPN
jgi:putative redox protein